MDQIRMYLLKVISAAVIVSIIRIIVGSKGPAAGILKIVSGFIMALCVISPFIQMEIRDLDFYMDELHQDGSFYAQNGKSFADEEFLSIIKEQTQAYILDKAAALGVNLQVNVVLGDEDPPVPYSIKLKGKISPYARSELQNYIASQIGIPKERQQWIQNG